jgi:CRP/FNR family cyclic AMP-dependent transcriptional regulator
MTAKASPMFYAPVNGQPRLRYNNPEVPRTGVAGCPPCVWCRGSGSEILATCVETLAATGLFTGVDCAAVTEIAGACEIVRVEARRTLFEEGEQCEGLWILAKGRLRLYHVDPEGRQFVMKFFKPGEAVQLSAALDGGSHGLSCAALEDSVLVLIPGALLQATLQTQLAFARNAVEGLCSILRRVNVGATTREFFDASSRVRCALVQFAHQYGVPTDNGGRRVNYRLTRQDIADYVGVTIETAIRILSQMQRDGVLTSEAKLLEIPDFSGFTKATGCADCQFDCRSIFGSGAPGGPDEAAPAPGTRLKALTISRGPGAEDPGRRASRPPGD